jgi:hypothetical protein
VPFAAVTGAQPAANGATLRPVQGRGRLVLVAFAFACALALAGGSARAQTGSRAETLDVYGGVGSWLDIFAGSPWARPEQVVSSLEAHGVRTLYLETSNYSHAAGVVYPAATGRMIEAAHAAGISVVAWYLPSFAHPKADAARALAAIRYRTPSGERFDSFALDIEASVVRNVPLRNARLLALSRTLRARAPKGYPLGAIIPSPVGMARHPAYWPRFPYAQLAGIYDAFVPMAYFTNYVDSRTGAYAYARDVVHAIRTETGRPDLPIHLIGGAAQSASNAAVDGFARAAADCAVEGLSLYAYVQTRAAEWTRLADTPLGPGVPAPACN